MAFYAQLDFHGDPNIGLYGLATDRFCLLGPETDKSKKLEEVLKVPIHGVHILHLELIRILIAGNSRTIVVPNMLLERDIAALEHALARHKTEVCVVDTEYALGNLVLMNSNGILVPPVLRRHQTKLEKMFGLPCRVATIAGLTPLASLGVANDRGCLVHPQVKDSEVKIIESTLGVPLDVGTVNFGSPYPGSAIIANNCGFAVGRGTSGPEMGRIAEALGFE
ncbi:MAG: translation initiation factor IF-6 [Candidatus Aenigmatarchaeota archaeon]